MVFWGLWGLQGLIGLLHEGEIRGQTKNTSTVREVMSGAASLQFSGGFTLPHRSDETLGRGASVGASSAHANGQRRFRQFRV